MGWELGAVPGRTAARLFHLGGARFSSQMLAIAVYIAKDGAKKAFEDWTREVGGIQGRGPKTLAARTYKAIGRHQWSP